MNRWPLISPGIAAFMLTGCFSVQVGEPTIDVEAAQARATRIEVRSTTRDAVHSLMGEPWLANDVFGVDLYRLQGKQRQLAIILGVPVPDFSDALDAYSLVTYDRDGVVSALASGHARASAPSPATVILRAGGFEFVHGLRDTLSVSVERYLAARPAASAAATCTVLLGADRSRLAGADAAGFCLCFADLSVDGGRKRTLRLMEPAVISYEQGTSRAGCESLGGTFNPLGGPEQGSCMLTPRARYALTLPAGTHLLHFTVGSNADVISTLDCQAGGVTYATLGGKFMACHRLEGGAPVDRGGAATVSLSQQAPAADGELGVVVYDNGQWLYPAVSP